MGRHKMRTDPQVNDALQVLGTAIRAARVEHRWTAEHLGGVVGCSGRTILAMEKAEPTVSIGYVFAAAVALRIPLFSSTGAELNRMARDARRINALLPARVVAVEEMTDDDF